VSLPKTFCDRCVTRNDGLAVVAEVLQVCSHGEYFVATNRPRIKRCSRQTFAQVYQFREREGCMERIALVKVDWLTAPDS
jgi:hypothetical protein